MMKHVADPQPFFQLFARDRRPPGILVMSQRLRDELVERFTLQDRPAEAQADGDPGYGWRT